jgi:hypothetical protein
LQWENHDEEDLPGANPDPTRKPFPRHRNNHCYFQRYEETYRLTAHWGNRWKTSGSTKQYPDLQGREEFAVSILLIRSAQNPRRHWIWRSSGGDP